MEQYKSSSSDPVDHSFGDEQRRAKNMCSSKPNMSDLGKSLYAMAEQLIAFENRLKTLEEGKMRLFILQDLN